MVTAVAVAAAHAGKTEVVWRAKEYFQADGLFLDPQSVLNAENKKCAVFHNLENARKCSKLIKGLQKHNRNIAKNGDRDKDIKKTADPVTFIADLYDVKDFLFHGMPFLKLRYTLL